MDILDIKMDSNDAGAKTIRDYLKALLRQMWKEEEGFSGKRPFGNSGWQYEVYHALVRAEAVKGELDDDGCLGIVDTEECDKLILAAIKRLR